MKIYTKTGDTGLTSLYNGERLAKDDIFFEVLGTIDELSSNIGMLYGLISSENNVKWTHIYLKNIQQNLQTIGTEIASPGKKVENLSPESVKDLETLIDRLEQDNDKLTKFILPGFSIPDSQAHICRSICRRVERCLWRFKKNLDVNPDTLKYINRLSDFFFVFARYICKVKNITEF